MLPDFPYIKEKFLEEAGRYLRTLVRNEPLLSQIKIVHHFEGNIMSVMTEDGGTDASEYKEFSANYSVDIGEIIEKGPMLVLENASKVAEEMKKKQSELLFKKIGDVTRKAGTDVDSKGKPFSHELFLESIKKIWIDFDKDGTPHLPTVLVSPELGAKLRTLLPEWEKNAEYERQFNEVIEQKRKEWNARESNRKLVD
jgi:hypothetical protein